MTAFVPNCDSVWSRPVPAREAPRVLTIINAAAEAYRGKIPEDCWHDPYMSSAELDAALAAGIEFVGIDIAGELAAVMGVQRVSNVHLIRHAYVLPKRQGMGLGRHLLEQICRTVEGQILVGTWRAATWAIRFYEARGFVMVPGGSSSLVLRAYWNITDRQIETSVVLARPNVDDEAVRALVAGARA